jgi:hypothetical protein
MKIYTIIALTVLLSLNGLSQSFKSGSLSGMIDSVAMGPGYANDVYYSFEDGIVATVPRTNWDIGFSTQIFSSNIITNGGATVNGVNLYTYPNSDTNGWSTVDTAGFSGWPVLYNSEDVWDDGAFSRNATGHPDYGWGKYNIANHNVVGDSIYILKTTTGTFKKIWILRKHSAENTYYIRHANLDGSDDHVVTLDINPYTSKNFVYYDFVADAFVDRDPDTASWDILFTKYIAIQENGMPYSWKYLIPGTFNYAVDDSTAYFVHTRKDNIYKLVFSKFEGGSTGKIIFSKELMSAAGIFENTPVEELTVYPNPVKDHFTLNFGLEIDGNAEISIFDITGRQVYTYNQNIEHNTITVALPQLNFFEGLHLIKIITDKGIFTSRFMVFNN